MLGPHVLPAWFAFVYQLVVQVLLVLNRRSRFFLVDKAGVFFVFGLGNMFEKPIDFGTGGTWLFGLRWDFSLGRFGKLGGVCHHFAFYELVPLFLEDGQVVG